MVYLKIINHGDGLLKNNWFTRILKFKNRKYSQEHWFEKKIEKYSLKLKKHWWYKAIRLKRSVRAFGRVKREEQLTEVRRVFVSRRRGKGRYIKRGISKLTKEEKPLVHSPSRRE